MPMAKITDMKLSGVMVFSVKSGGVEGVFLCLFLEAWITKGHPWEDH